jgi:uncharacterized membrane protein YdjX (TVP38/TMEM64 family)
MRTGPRLKHTIALLGFPAVIVLAIFLAVVFRGRLPGKFLSAESIRAWVASKGVLAPLAFMGLQAIQVIIFVIPGEIVQVAGGFAFGLWGGTLWSVLGILLGSLVNFGVGRMLGRPFVEAVFGTSKAEKIETATAGGKAAAGFFLLFAIPGIPKDALTYAAGASRLSFFSFLLVSTIGRLPGILGSSFMGSAAFEKDYQAALIVAIVASTLFFLGLLFRDKLHDIIGRFVSRTRHGPR